MDDIKERIKVKEFLNWVKSTLGLEQTKKALEDYVEQKFILYTDGTARLCNGKLPTREEVMHMHSFFCDEVFLNSIECKGGNWTWTKNCTCQCESTFQKVLSLQIKKSGLCWKNNVKNTPTSLEWKIAKVFMPKGNEANKGPKDTDPYAMFYLMNQCDLFFNCIKSNHLEKSKAIRNSLFHSSENHVTDDDQEEYFNTMIALLTDASKDTEVPQTTQNQITNDIAKLKKLQTSDITMTVFDDLDKALRIKRTGIYYDFENRLCENDPEKLRESLKVMKQIGNMQDSKWQIENQKFKTEINELHKQRDIVKKVVEKIPKTVRDINAQNKQLRTDVNVMVKDLSAKHKKLRETFQGSENILQQFDIIKAEMGDWKRNLRRKISEVESEGMIIVVIVTVIMSVLFRILLFLD